ncbi:ANTAR domain-containing response regulator [Streptomyces pseudovenezuelae]|uniref:GAF domain-containing protein n=1 Tax=Streptomyces pseudovenezuelae TaxID=67350 RepID=A0ABT6LGG6_9ACTN|nr:ANTAR domain-containing protein [Streptomyces pseudovenezuelae]MDH6214721.1 GAF domain-containing protein [Streptomyces pseudovenezuelae]
MTPEQRLADAFVALAGSTADGPLDVPETLTVLAHRAPVLLGTRAAAVQFAPAGHDTALVVGSDPQVFHLEHEAAGRREGPGHECRRTGAGVPWAQAALDSGPVRQRWPHYAPKALRLGYTQVVALPLREHTGTSGALVLLSGAERAFSPATLGLGRSLADFTAVILERAREADRSRTLTAQLEQALTGRVVIEQAKGILATRRAVTPDGAFDLLRKYARAHQRSVRDVARDVVEGRSDLDRTDPAR